MDVAKVMAVALAAATLGAGSAGAVTFDQIDGPAEYPPADFRGVQYVDSKGCMFMRAGYAGQVTWVPRVTRDRQVICGQTPSFAALVAAPAPAVIAAPAPVPEPVPAAPPVRAATKPAPEPTRIPAPSDVGPPMETIASTTVAPRGGTGQTARTATVPRSPVAPAVAAAAAASPDPGPRIVDGRVVCPNRSPVAQKLMLSDGRRAVRCVPQSEDPYSYGAATAAAGTGKGTGRSAAASTTLATVEPVRIPSGYKAAWQDGRLNPMRGVGTAQGQAQMARLWSDDVPMKGRETVVLRGTDTTAGQVTVASKSVASAPVPALEGRGRYVQVGTYGVASNASGAVATLAAAGLPVNRSRIRSGGRELQVVLAGPFAPAHLTAALLAARRAGFTDAFVK